MRKLLQLSLAAALVGAPLQAQVTVSTGTPTDYVFPFGKDSEFGAIPSVVAQTFLTPGGASYLQSFTLFYSNFVNGDALKLVASVYEFDTDHLKGSALFSSVLFNGTDELTDVPVTFGNASDSPLNLFLSPGTIYAFVLSSVEGYEKTLDGSTILFGASAVDAYAGGSLFISTATDAASLSAPGAFSSDYPPDAAFSATFTKEAVVATPEPASLLLVATGLIGIGGVVRRRRRNAVITGSEATRDLLSAAAPKSC